MSSFTAAWRLDRRLAVAGGRDTRLPGLLAVLGYAVATGALLLAVGGLHAFLTRQAHGLAPASLGTLYIGLAYVACGLLVAPVLTLGGVAARLTLGRRHQRLAALRLAGATAAQVTVMTIAECARLALTGAVAGVLLYAVVLPVAPLVTFQRHPLAVGEVWVGVPVALAAVAAVVLLGVGSGLVGLRRVVVGPLGVTARHTPGRLSALRVVLTLALFGAWFVLSGVLGRLGMAVLLALVAAMVAVLNLLGPWVVMVLGRLMVRLARRPATLLAARRIVDDPKSTWRTVGALGLGITIAGLSSFFAAVSAAPGDMAGRTLLHDLGTGALLTLVVVAVVAATSSGVVQAARVVDRREEYRGLALAGTDLPLLHSARMREVVVPLAGTVSVASGAALAILLPFGRSLDAAVFVRLGVAVLGACALMALAVTASRPLVREAAVLDRAADGG